MDSAATARLRLVAAAILFSTGGAAIKALPFTGVQVACLRSGIAAVTLAILLPAARRRWSLPVLAVGSTYAATLILFVLSNKLTTAARAIFLQATAPLYLLMLGPWLLGEPVRRRDLLFMLAVGGGMGMILAGADPAADTAPDPALGNLLGAATGVAWALTVAGLRWAARSVTGETDADPAAMVVVAGNVLAGAACLPWALPLPAARPIDVSLILYLGVVQIGVAYLLLTRGMRRVPALEASLLLLVEPVLNPIWAWMAHGERPGGWTLAGGALILGTTAARTFTASRRGDA